MSQKHGMIQKHGMSQKHRVVAAIDFGTYGTGFAWATVNRENDDLFDRKIKHFFQWKDQRTIYAKNRSALLIAPDGTLMAWGHEAFRLRNAGNGKAGKLHSGFKMDLQPNLGDGLRADDAPRGRIRDKDEAFQLIVMCLREAFKAACTDIVQGVYRETDIRWCVTVPAIWDSFTNDLMYRAAVAAGLPDDLDRLILAREPAAAALYCVASGEERLRESGTRFMVVDAGGGSIDIASYIVRQEGRLSGLANPDGTKAGSEFLNRKFMELELSRELGADRLTWLNMRYRAELSAVMDAFEREKLSFDVDSGDGLRVDLGRTIHQALVQRWEADQRGPEPPRVLVFERRVIAALFEEMLAETLPKVDAQLEAMRVATGQRGDERIVLVGGFAQSPYLRNRMRDHVRELGATLIVPPRPELAVLSGAVHFAYDPDAFLSWPSPLTYGVRSSAKFRPGIDPEPSKIMNKDGSLWCRDRFSVLVKAGAQLSPAEPVTKIYLPINEVIPVLTIRLFATDRPDVQFTSDLGVAEAGKMLVDLSSSVGRPVKERAVEITLKFHQTRFVVTARSVYSGDEVSVQIKWRPTW